MIGQTAIVLTGQIALLHSTISCWFGNAQKHGDISHLRWLTPDRGSVQMLIRAARFQYRTTTTRSQSPIAGEVR